MPFWPAWGWVLSESCQNHLRKFGRTSSMDQDRLLEPHQKWRDSTLNLGFRGLQVGDLFLVKSFAINMFIFKNMVRPSGCLPKKLGTHMTRMESEDLMLGRLYRQAAITSFSKFKAHGFFHSPGQHIFWNGSYVHLKWTDALGRLEKRVLLHLLGFGTSWFTVSSKIQ